MRPEQRFLQKFFGVFFVCLLALLPIDPADAQACDYQGGWQERTTPSFSIIYPPSYEGLVNEIVQIVDGQLERELEDFAAIFQTPLVTPLTIRIYPNSASYYCLNPVVTEIDLTINHSHIGDHEIALIGDRLPSLLSEAQIESVNAFRAELATLFAETRSNGTAPPGVLAGIGGYSEDPNQMFVEYYEASGLETAPVRSWQAVWDDPLAASKADVRFMATSITAYLIDIYGWSNYLSFLGELGEARGYRSALETVYGLSLAELDRHWQETYFPVYVAGRWRANLFYSFDLSVFEEMIAAGAYSDAVSGLEDAIPVIEQLGTVEEFVLAGDLLEQAQLGQTATSRMESARKALLDGDFETSLSLAEEAAAIYDQLENGQRELELKTYIEWSSQVLKLRSELESQSAQGGWLNPTGPKNIIDIGNGLAELGDAEGVAAAQAALNVVSSQAMPVQGILILLGVLVVFYLVARRILRLFEKVPPEANLV